METLSWLIMTTITEESEYGSNETAAKASGRHFEGRLLEAFIHNRSEHGFYVRCFEENIVKNCERSWDCHAGHGFEAVKSFRYNTRSMVEPSKEL